MSSNFGPFGNALQTVYETGAYPLYFSHCASALHIAVIQETNFEIAVYYMQDLVCKW